MSNSKHIIRGWGLGVCHSHQSQKKYIILLVSGCPVPFCHCYCRFQLL